MIWWLAVLAAVGGFAIGGLLGAPFLPTRRRDYQGIFDLLDLQPGQTLYELGSGGGGLLREAAKRGIKSVGFEINPWLWAWSRIRLWPYRRLTQVTLANFWAADLGPADAVYVFLIPRRMRQLENKLRSVRRPLKVVSYAFQLPGLKPSAGHQNYWLYRLADSAK